MEGKRSIWISWNYNLIDCGVRIILIGMQQAVNATMTVMKSVLKPGGLVAANNDAAGSFAHLLPTNQQANLV